MTGSPSTNKRHDTLQNKIIREGRERERETRHGLPATKTQLKTDRRVNDGTWRSEQEVSDGGQQLGQLRLHVGCLSDGVAAEIEAPQLGAGGQRLKVCQRGDLCEFWVNEK